MQIYNFIYICKKFVFSESSPLGYRKKSLCGISITKDRALPTTRLSHQKTCTSLLESLIHQRADSRSKKNYNRAAYGTKTTFTER